MLVGTVSADPQTRRLNFDDTDRNQPKAGLIFGLWQSSKSVGRDSRRHDDNGFPQAGVP
jgi:hypothetical protein